MPIKRQSNFETVRLVAMFFIVFYHLMLWGSSLGIPDFKLLWIPLHVAVPLFVLISGYFHIHPSAKGLTKLLLPLIVYYIPIALILTALHDYSMEGVKLWFYRTYLLLYIISPVINKYLVGILPSQRVKLIIILTIFACGIGLFGNDANLSEGKNPIYFMLLYVIGDTLRTYQHIWQRIKLYRLIAGWLFYNVFLVLSAYIIGHGFWIFFSYCSPLEVINAIWLFIIFGKIRFSSSRINYISASVFAVYLISCEPTVMNRVLKPIIFSLYQHSDNLAIYLSMLIVFSLVVMAACIFIDKILHPIWNMGSLCGKRVDAYILRKAIEIDKKV